MPQVPITHDTLLAAGFVLKERVENNHPLAPIKICFENCYWKNDLMLQREQDNSYTFLRIRISPMHYSETLLAKDLKYLEEISKTLHEHLHTSILNSISEQRY